MAKTQAKVYKWIVFTDTFLTVAPTRIAKLPEKCELAQGDMGKLVSHEIAATIKWNYRDTYEQFETVVVKCEDEKIRYGCIHKKVFAWFVACKDSHGNEIYRIFEPEEIGKIVNATF